jgi:hypothetical protein
MRELKFRQPIFTKDGFERWHYWGFTERGMFSGPMPPLDRESYQFTGLLDKNGKEIWEGDILKGHATGITYAVFFENGSYFARSGSIVLSRTDFRNNDVIGNIFEGGE